MSTPAQARPTNVRWIVVAVTTLMAVLLYLDRFCLSMAVTYIREEMQLSATQVGWILGAFFWTYALGQVPSGWFTDRFGARRMLTIYILAWSLFTGLTGLATGFVVLLVLRLGFGFAQAGAYPTAGNVLSKWIPFKSRGIASGIVSSGGRLGGILAPVLTGLLIVMFVPVTTSSEFTTDDLLDPARLCFHLAPPAGGAAEVDITPQAQMGERLYRRLSTQTQALIGPNAAAHADYQQKLDAYEEMKKTSGEDPSNQPPERPGSQGDIDAPLVAALNAALHDPDLYRKSIFESISLPSQAKQLLRIEAGKRTEQDQLRLNRLLLEAVYPDSLMKLYRMGWRPVLATYGLIGILIALLFWVTFRNRPGEHPRCNAAEVALIESDRPAEATRPDGEVGSVPFGPLIRSLSMWCNCLAQFTINVGWIFIATWLPEYLNKVHHVSIEQRGLMATIPFFFGWIGMVAGGPVTDYLVRLLGLRWGRVAPMFASKCIGIAAYLYCIFFEPSAWGAVAAFSLVAFSTDLGVPSIWAYVQDVGGKNVGSVLGWGNMWGNFGAAITAPLLGWVVEKSGNNWSLAFALCAGGFAVSALASLGIDATKPIDDDRESKQFADA